MMRGQSPATRSRCQGRQSEHSLVCSHTPCGTTNTMDEDPPAPTVSFDRSEGRNALFPHFQDILPLSADSVMDLESGSVCDQARHFQDPDPHFISFDWDATTSSALLSECFDFELSDGCGLEEHTMDPTEVSEDEMDVETSSFEQRFQENAKRLAESMEKSRKSRVSLTLESPTVALYPRRKSLSCIVSSVQKSSEQLLTTFGSSRSPSLSSDP